MKRCAWPKTALEIAYHDQEWGKISFDKRYLFEMLVLEMMQAGLSWRTILEKRENYREVFFNFEVDKVAKMDPKLLYDNPKIVRNKLKIDAIIHNAKIIVEKEIDLSQWIWSYTQGVAIIHDIKVESQVPSFNSLSTQISKDMKKIGFKFVGPTIIYSYMHAIGMVDDHVNSCDFKSKTP